MDERLDKIIIEVLDLDDGELSDELTPESAEYWDSLSHLRLVTAVEQAFSIKLSMEEIQSIESVADLRAVVGRHVAAS